MVNPFRPVESEFGEYEFKHLEVIILLVTYHIDVRIEMRLLETPFRSTEILGDVHRCAVASQKYLSVESVRCQIAPYAAVRVLYEDALFKTLLHQLLTQKISL